VLQLELPSVSKKMVGGSGGPDSVEIERGEALLTAAARVLDAHLARKQWIAQDKFTLADLAIASPLMHTTAAQLPSRAIRQPASVV
jgi:glutathione S-transferase